MKERTDLPSPSYVLDSSPNHAHVFWRVEGFGRDLVEQLQKQLTRELQTDPAATPVTQNTRLPGFVNHKRAQPHLVTIEYRNVDVRYGPEAFPPVKEATFLAPISSVTPLCLRRGRFDVASRPHPLTDRPFIRPIVQSKRAC